MFAVEIALERTAGHPALFLWIGPAVLLLVDGSVVALFLRRHALGELVLPPIVPHIRIGLL
jgi:cytochrome c-type biogenesis protein CcmH/NrfF